MRYTIPAAQVAAPHTATVEVHKSRFIGWCAHAPDTDTARALVAAARAQYPDASHHCSAYIAGAPDEQQAIGFADDGEPGGTAGRPMFQALAGSGLGQIACVVIRYFGGTKLGTGGLARAYAQCVSALLADLPVAAYVPRQPMVLEMGFAMGHSFAKNAVCQKRTTLKSHQCLTIATVVLLEAEGISIDVSTYIYK